MCIRDRVEAVQGVMFTTIFPITFLSNAFARPEGMPDWLRFLAEWNPISALVQAMRELWGNDGLPLAADAAWPMQNPVIATIIWPVGLSAALACIQRGLSYVLLEKEQEIASTITRYPKGKLVMAEPYDTRNLSLLPVFDSSKEQLVAIWRELIERAGVTINQGEAVESVLKPRYVKPPPDEPRFNYIVDLFTKWHGRYFYFCSRYAVPGPNAIQPFFEDRFARLEYAGSNRFNLAFMRHTGHQAAERHHLLGVQQLALGAFQVVVGLAQRRLSGGGGRGRARGASGGGGGAPPRRRTSSSTSTARSPPSRPRARRSATTAGSSAARPTRSRASATRRCSRAPSSSTSRPAS